MPAGVPYVVQARWILLIMVFSCFFILSAQRINMSIAILSMVNWTDIRNTSLNYCPTTKNGDLNEEDGEFNWPLNFQAQVLVSYFYGLILIQLPAEMFVERFSPQFTAFVAMSLSSICNFVTPTAASWHIGALINLQIIKAMGHTMVLSAFSVMLGKWIPTRQLVRFSAYTTSSIPIGAFFTVIGAGIASSHHGWPFIFYVSGTLGVLWSLLWLYLCCDLRFMPILSTSSRILETSFPRKDLPVPFKEILLSKPFWGYVASGVASYWMIAMNLFIMPTYFKVVFKMGIEWNGLVSSFPNVLQAFLYLFSFTFLRKKTGSKTSLRRTIACIGIATFSTCVVLLSFVQCKKSLGVLLMAIGIGASGCNFAAMSLIAVDMSPNFSGIVSGMMNTIGAIAGCGLPLSIGYLIEGHGDIRDWEKVFYATAFVNFICMILFMAFSSCEIQSWNNPQQHRTSFIDMSKSLISTSSPIELRSSATNFSQPGPSEGTMVETKSSSSTSKLKK